MEIEKKFLLFLVIVLLYCCSLVSAGSITFIDTAGVYNGTLKISASNGTPLAALNTSESMSVSNLTAYHLDYSPSGLYSLQNEKVLGVNWTSGEVTMPDFGGFKFYMHYFSNPLNILVVIFLIFCLLILVI